MFTVELPFELANKHSASVKYPSMNAIKVLVCDNDKSSLLIRFNAFRKIRYFCKMGSKRS